MTFKTAELPIKFYLKFDGDDETYDAEIIEITEIDETSDTCLLLVSGIMPQVARIQIPYSDLDSSVDTGVMLSLENPDD